MFFSSKNEENSSKILIKKYYIKKIAIFVKCSKCNSKSATVRCFSCNISEVRKFCYNCDNKIHNIESNHKKEIIPYAGKFKKKFYFNFYFFL